MESHNISMPNIMGQSSLNIKTLSSRLSRGKNLTGIPRHVRDLAANIHANIQKWNACNIEGVVFLKSITQEKCDARYSSHLQDLCDKLEDICNRLDDLIKSFEQIACQLKLVTSIHKHSDKLFATWPTTNFGYVADLIYKAYSEEVKIKRTILENIAHNHTESWKMLHLATWVYEPMLPENLIILLESMLTECGHR